MIFLYYIAKTIDTRLAAVIAINREALSAQLWLYRVTVCAEIKSSSVMHHIRQQGADSPTNGQPRCLQTVI